MENEATRERWGKLNILKELKADLNDFSFGEKAVLRGEIAKEIKALKTKLKEYQAFYDLIVALDKDVNE
jgi:hypothetical protein